MKQIIILCALLIGCSSSGERSDWDSGASKQQSFQQERMEETTDQTRMQDTRSVHEIRPF